MSTSACRLAATAIAGALAASFTAPASAELLTHKDLSLETAVAIATTAAATCKAQGYNVSVHVLGRTGEVVVALRGDNASPHTMENSMRKAFTARTFRVSSGEFAKRFEQPGANTAATMLTNVIAIQGALPIKIGDDVIGSVGVSGAPGGDKDEACAKTGLDKVADQLK
jgi:uncharacterized protein GlcG (DUF336 family)